MHTQTVDYKAFEGRLEALCETEVGVKWERGWLLVEAEQALGEDAWQLVDVAERHGIAASTLKVEHWVASRFPRGTTIEGATWTHHRSVAAWPEDRLEERDALLRKAVDEGWSASYLAEVSEATLDGGTGPDGMADPATMGLVDYMAARLRELCPWIRPKQAKEVGEAAIRAYDEWWNENGEAVEAAALGEGAA